MSRADFTLGWCVRTLVAVTLAPLATGVLLTFPVLLDDPSGGFWLTLLVAIFAGIGVLAVGLPFHLLFTWLGWRGLGPYLAAGALAPGLAALGYEALYGRSGPGLETWLGACLLGLIGMFCATVGWWVAIGRFERPEEY